MKKYRHRRKPYWRLWYIHGTMYWQTSEDRFHRYGDAFKEFMGLIEHIKPGGFRSIELQRVQPLEPGEPGWCSHNTEHHEVLIRRACP